MLQSYEELELRVALSRRWDYVEACKELAVILRGAYSKVPKNLQALMFQDTLAAFRLLPGADTSQRILAANLLLQAAEASLPKQKKALAITEFKHAAVALRRHSKFRHQEADPLQLTNDVLVHIFGFLDVRSLVSTGLVCRYWNLASKDNTLWQAKYQLHFDTCLPNDAHRKKSMNNALDDKVGSHNQNLQRLELGVHTDWYEAFKIAFEGHPSRVFMSNRAYCPTCKLTFWLNNRDSSLDGRISKHSHQHRLKPMRPDQVLHFLLSESLESSSSSSSDSDSEGVLVVDQRLSKLWAYPKLT
ncbi:hypothetical protein SUGI_0778550 [Cryptomeria japonica]|uniref:F-box protein At5g52880 isoform X2 n=1 Tax=Cryptomeria japonica TaxID=3369 RepID=UPI002414B7AE|nr:F-box protein At5g52880 isoform X2 [Cryptomeria japonica]GLJ38243.1 hypothetical protein SUGI_0778550 [Cryptomeria japonica]